MIRPNCSECGGRMTARYGFSCPHCRKLDEQRLRARRREQAPQYRYHGPVCPLCAGLPHRVVGKRCRKCHLRRARESKPTIDFFAAQRKGVDVP